MYLKFSILFVLIFSIILLSWNNCLVQCKGGGFRGSSSARSFSSGSSSYGRSSSSRSSGSGSFGSYYGEGDRKDDNRNRIWRVAAVVIFWCAVFILLLTIVFLCWRHFCPNNDCTGHSNDEAKEQEEPNNLAHHQQQQQRPLMDSYIHYQRDNLHCTLQPHQHYCTEKHTWIM